MAKAKKVLSAVLAALMVVFTVASYVPAQAAKKAVVPQIKLVEQPKAEYKVGERMYTKVQCANYSGKVEYRATLWDGAAGKQIEVWKTFPYYYKNWTPTGKTVFPITWVVEKPGVYNLTIYVRPLGSKVPFSTLAKSANFTVVANDKISEIAPVEATVDEGAEYKLPAQVEAKMADNTTKMVDVNWGDSKVDTTKAGEFKFAGKVEGYDKDVELKLTVKAVELKVESVSAIKANQIKIVLNKVVDTTKTSIVVKKGSISTNVSKTEWSEDKKAVTLTTTTRLSKGEYTVSVTSDPYKDVTGKVTVEDEKVTKIEITSDKLVLTNDTLTEAKVGYAIYNQYNEDISARISTINWTSSVGTPSASKGTLTIPNANKYQLDQKVVVTALETTTGIFASATLTVSRKAYVNEIAIGELASDDAKITVLNVANIKHFYLPVTLKDQYGNVIDDPATANKNTELLKIVANINGSFDNDDDGNLIFVLEPAAQQFAGKAMITFVAANSGNRATKEFEIVSNPAIADLTMEFPDIIAAGDTNVAVKYSAVDQFGNEVKDVDKLNAILKDLGVAGGNLTNANFKFAKDVKTGEIKLTLDASKAAKGRVFLTLLTPGSKVFTTNFEVKDARKYVVVSGISSKLTTNYVINSTGKITSAHITLLDQYGKAWALADLPSTVKVNLTISGDGKIIAPASSVLTGGDTSVAISAVAKGTATVTVAIAGVNDSAYTFKLNVVEAKNVTTYDVADIATLNGNIGASAPVKVTGKLSDGSTIALDYSVIKGIISSNPSVLTVDLAARTITAVKNTDTTLDDATVKIIVTIEGPEGSVMVTKDVKVSYKKAVPASIEADPDNEDIVNGVAYVSGDTDPKTLFVVTDQYGKDIADNLVIIPTNVTKDGCDVVAFTSNGLSAKLKMVYTSAPTPKPVVDKTALKAEIAKAEATKNDGYTAESWTAFQTALTAAKAVDAKADATQKEVDDAIVALKAVKLEKPVVVAEITATAEGTYSYTLGGDVYGKITDKNSVVKDFSAYTVKVTSEKGDVIASVKADAAGNYSVELPDSDLVLSIAKKVIVVVNDGTKDVYTSLAITLK